MNILNYLINVNAQINSSQRIIETESKIAQSLQNSQVHTPVPMPTPQSSANTTLSFTNVSMLSKSPNIDFDFSEISPNNGPLMQECFAEARMKMEASKDLADLGLNIANLFNTKYPFIIEEILLNLATKLQFRAGNDYPRFHIFINRNLTDQQKQKIFDIYLIIIKERNQKLVNAMADNSALYFYYRDEHKVLNSLIPCIPFCRHSTHESPLLLFMASACGETSRFRDCLKAGIPAEVQNRNKLLPFHFAVINGQIDILKIYLVEMKMAISDTWPRPILFDIHDPKTLDFLIQQNFPFDLTRMNYNETVLDALMGRLLSYDDNINRIAYIKLLLIKFPQLLIQPTADGIPIIKYFFQLIIRSTTEPLNETYINNILLVFKFSASLQLKEFAFVQDEMRYRILQGEKQWLEYFEEAEQKALTEQLAKKDTPDGQLAIKLTSTIYALKETLQLWNLNPEGIPLHIPYQAYLLKKELKKHKDKVSLIQHAEFVELYDRLVERHPTLKSIRTFSRIYRKKEKPTAGAKKFNELWSDFSLKDSFSVEGPRIRNRISVADAVLKSSLPNQSSLRLVHGTKSNALPVIFATGDQLKPGGGWEEDLVPLSGSGLGIADLRGMSKKEISTLELDAFWEQDAPKLNSTATNRFSVAGEYASALIQGVGDNAVSLTFQRSSEFTIFNNACQKIYDKLDPKKGNDYNWFWFCFQRSIMRLKLTGNKDFMEMSTTDLEKIRKIHVATPRNELAQVIAIWTKEQTIEVDPKDPLIEKQWPILFASTKYSVEHDSRPHRQEFEQLLVGHALTLQKDIDVVYTEVEAIETVARCLAPKGVKVLPMDVGRLQATKQMAIGSQLRALQASTKELESFQSSIAPLKNVFQQIILPYYATPLPERPVYVKDGVELAVRYPYYGDKYKLSYKDYAKDLQLGNAPARDIHGSMHASRMLFFSLIIFQVRGDVQKPYHLAVAAACHDMLRQDEGLDQWERVSAEEMSRLLRYDPNISQEYRTVLYEAISQKEDRDHPTPEKEVIRDADTLEIMRCSHVGRAKFESQRLSETLQEKLGENLAAFVEEAADFIEFTENAAMKLSLEKHSQDYLGDIARIFVRLHDKSKGYPIMHKYLAPILKELTAGGSLPKEVIDTI